MPLVVLGGEGWVEQKARVQARRSANSGAAYAGRIESRRTFGCRSDCVFPNRLLMYPVIRIFELASSFNADTDILKNPNREYEMRLPILFLFICLSSCLAEAVEPVELYYFVNQRAYLVDKAKDGFPILDTEVDADSVAALEGHRHKAWAYKGDLTLSSKFAYALVDYRLKRIPLPYGEKDEKERYKLGKGFAPNSRESPLFRGLDGFGLGIRWKNSEYSSDQAVKGLVRRDCE